MLAVTAVSAPVGTDGVSPVCNSDPGRRFPGHRTPGANTRRDDTAPGGGRRFDCMTDLAETVVVVGAGPGMGLAVARRFAAEGFARSSSPATPAGIDAPDLDDLGAVRACRRRRRRGVSAGAFAQVRDRVGDPAVLVFNPSLGISGAAQPRSPRPRSRAGLAIGAVAAVTATQEVVPAMRAAGRGTLLFTGGGLALKPWAPMAALGMQKAALRNYVARPGRRGGAARHPRCHGHDPGRGRREPRLRPRGAGGALLDPARPTARRPGRPSSLASGG